MFSLDRNGKETRANCGTETTRKNFGLHTTKCSTGTLYCTQWRNFSKTNHFGLICHIAKKHSESKPRVTHDRQECGENFPDFYSLPQLKVQHRNLRKKSEETEALQALEKNNTANTLQDETQSHKQFRVD